jgi:prephenate dehydrogenase
MLFDPPANMVVIGAQGQMGRRFASALRQAGHHVTEFDYPLDMSALPLAVRTAALVLLCVPITAMDAVVSAVAPHLTSETILADICSVKTAPLSTMLTATHTPVVGTHPLFGPETTGDLRVAVVPGRGQGASENMERLFRTLGFSTFITTADEHDRAMAYIQSLNFVTTVAYLCAAPLEQGMERFFTPSFSRRMDSAAKMLTEDADLFTALFESNPRSLEAVRLFRSYLNIAAGGDLELLSRKALRWWES